MRPVDKSRYSDNKQGYYAALDVEHIHAKSHNPDLKFLWDNFLLGCKNCNPIKGKKSVDGIMLPHIDNTHIAFEYLEGGVIKLNNQLDDTTKTKAQKLIQLVGLDRRPGKPNYSGNDKRWQERQEVWQIANRYLEKYRLQSCDIETLIDLALSKGFWSVWMSVFSEYPEVQAILITKFKGTRLSCFKL